MKELMKRFAGALFGSKKAVAMLAGVLLALLAPLVRKVGWEIEQSQIEWALMIIGGYIIAQGYADGGKEAAKVAAAPVAKLKAKAK